jgi:hypothetical protein
MKLDYSPEELAFKEEVRQFLKTHLPREIHDRMHRSDRSQIKSDMVQWQKILHGNGWGAPAWPAEFGGTGWTKTQQYIFESECAMADAPAQLPFGLKMVAPVIMQFGNAEQQAHFLPRILSGEDWWCQGYSEPGSGSDLASLKMKAERDGDHYIVTGQKIWNTMGQFADWIFCLVRTDSQAKQQRGISFLLVDMKSPGIKIQPTRLLDGTNEVNEIWFDQVRVPAINLVGEENKGWTYAKFLLGHERTNIAGIGNSKRALLDLKQSAAKKIIDGISMLQNPVFSSRIAQLEIELRALEITNMRVIFDAAKQKAPGPEASLLKIRGSEIMQRISELQLELQGPLGLAMDDSEEASITRAYLNLRKLSIFGGSNEIQRNIITHMLMGL